MILKRETVRSLMLFNAGINNEVTHHLTSDINIYSRFSFYSLILGDTGKRKQQFIAIITSTVSFKKSGPGV